MSQPLPSYRVVIPTSGQRGELLRGLLVCLAGQDHPPEEVVVVDSSLDQAAGPVVAEQTARLAVSHHASPVRSAAQQRNRGAEGAGTELVLFCDDDISFDPGFVRCLLEPFTSREGERTGGVAARMEGLTHPMPRGLFRHYCRLQAGYADATYGGRLIGPAINFLPCYEHQTERWIRSEWLNSGCVAYRTEIFRREQFPLFDGYSFMEDVHLSARVGQTHHLYFHREAVFFHHGESTSIAHGHAGLARMQIRNRRIIARDVLGLGPVEREARLLLHRLFITATQLRSRPPGWASHVMGTWTA